MILASASDAMTLASVSDLNPELTPIWLVLLILAIILKID